MLRFADRQFYSVSRALDSTCSPTLDFLGLVDGHVLEQLLPNVEHRTYIVLAVSRRTHSPSGRSRLALHLRLSRLPQGTSSDASPPGLHAILFLAARCEVPSRVHVRRYFPQRLRARVHHRSSLRLLLSHPFHSIRRSRIDRKSVV